MPTATPPPPPPIEREDVRAVLSLFAPGQASLIHALQAVQQRFGWLPEVALKVVAEQLAVPLAKVYGVASFYTQLHLTPRGKHVIKVCKGTACHVRGAQLIEDELGRALAVAPGQTTADGQYTLETVNCVGACGMAPVVMVDEAYHGGVRPDRASRLLSGKKGQTT